MQSVIDAVFFHHDLRLVALAAFIDALSAFAGVTLLNHARRTDGAMKYAWVGVAAVAVGFGIWATHFVAMLAFHPGMPVGYDMPLTLLSLAIAIVIVGGGIWFATIGQRRSDLVLGGAIVGIGIAAMHYVGMAALLLGGITWDPTLVASSIALGMGFGGAALFVGTRGPNSACVSAARCCWFSPSSRCTSPPWALPVSRTATPLSTLAIRPRFGSRSSWLPPPS